MRNFCQTLLDVGATYGKVDANVLLPARNTVGRQLYQTAAEERGNIVNLVEKAISNNGGVAMTVDLWADNYKKQCILSCTMHWIDKCLVKQNALFCKLFQPAVKSAGKIKNELLRSLAKHGISNDVIRSSVVFVSYRGANVKKTLEQFNLLPCSCHVLDIILLHAFKMSAEKSEKGSQEDDDIECVLKVQAQPPTFTVRK